MKNYFALALFFMSTSLFACQKAQTAEPQDTAQEPLNNPEYLQAKKTDWCPTEVLWEARRAKLALSQAVAACPVEGQCDDPVVRDATDKSQVKTIRVIVHVMRTDSGGDRKSVV